MIRTSDLTNGRLSCAEHGVFLDGPIDPTQLLQPNDILLSRAGTIGRSFLAPDSAKGMTFAGFLVRFRPREGSDPRFLNWAIQSQPVQDQIRSEAITSTISNFNADRYANLRLPNATTEEQRRIADFLDDRVSRIDRIIAARREQRWLVIDQHSSQLEELLRARDTTLRPLQTLTNPARPIQYGIVLPGPDFPGGVPIIKGGDIGSGRLDRLELNRTDPTIEAVYARSRVRPGDFVIAIRGSVGEVAPVPADLKSANLTQDSARIAPFNCDPGWLRAVLESPSVQASIAQRITGATVRGINIGELRRVPVPVPSRPDQEHVGRTAAGLRERVRGHEDALERSTALLTEYKSSLITAAVTGELDVTTSGSNIPG